MRFSLSAVVAAGFTVLALGLTACSVSSNKANGGDNVRINTPFGGMHVESNQTTAADLGLPVYPGATLYQDKSNSSANVNMSFGSFHLKVLAVSYQSPDSADKVFAFYRKALAQYGDVLECDNDKPVGSPAVSSSGLTCTDDEHGNSGKHVHTNMGGMNLNHDGHELRAGSPHAFRVVELDADHPGKIGLVYLELPRDDKSGSTN
jgi:hypothetical protein